jgi:rhamnose utilization protein RhaD (predicted bifunctional aldolase and dehydrogenase)
METRDKSMTASLAKLSARIGSDPLLVQASTGNTSIKTNGILWIKASGRSLADAARGDIFMPVDLTENQRRVERGQPPEAESTDCAGNPMRPSIETAMHVVLPWRVVLHVHSINAIAWAVRHDGQTRLRERLAGLAWEWIPYVESGLPLAREIERAVARSPHANVFVLANHGLVVCGQDCDSAGNLLGEVEVRLAISPQRVPEPRYAILSAIAGVSRFRLPAGPAVHALGTGSVPRRILRGGILYPCQAIFLGPVAPLVPCAVPFSDAVDRYGDPFRGSPFLIIEGSGVVVRDTITRAEMQTLAGLAEIAQRIEADARIRYLSAGEVNNVLNAEGYHYRDSVDRYTSQSGSDSSMELPAAGV